MRRLGVGVYRWLLDALRPDLAPVAPEMVDAVRRRLAAAPGPGAGRIWLLEVVDLVRGAAARWGAEWSRAARAARRGLVRAPASAILGVGAMAAGVAALTVTTAVLATVRFDGLPYPAAERLHALGVVREGTDGSSRALRVVEWEAYRQLAAEGTSALEAVGASWSWTATLSGDGAPRRLPAMRVTPGWFEVLGARPALGRFLGSAPDDAAVPRAVLSWRLWTDRFGGRDDVVGRTVVLDGASHEVVGVAPRGFRPPRGTADLFVHHARGTEGWIGRWLDGVVRIDPDGDLDALVRRLDALNESAARRAGVSEGWRVRLRPLHTTVFGDVEPALRLAAAVAALLFLATASSVAGLVLARTLRRRAEFAVRRALGAGVRGLGRIVALEGVALAGVGGLAGLAVGLWGVYGVLTTGPDLVPHADPTRSLTWGLVLGGSGIVAVAALLAAVPPRIARAVAPHHPSFRAIDTGGSGRRWSGAKLLLTGQVALAFVLVATAASLAGSLRALAREPLGFDPVAAAAVRLALPPDRYADARAVAEFYEEVTAALEGRPDVAAAGVGSNLPLEGTGAWGTAWTPATADDGGVPVLQRVAGPGWFEAAGVALLEGRDFTAGDGEGEPRVIVSRGLARALWPDGSAVGRRMAPHRDPDDGWATVVGVVEDVRYEGLESQGRPQYYEAHRAAPWTEMVLVVRGEAAARDPAALVRAIVAERDPDVPVEDHGPLDGVVARATAPRRITGGVAALFALGAIGVVGAGVGGVAGVSVDRRRREFAVRRAVGAGSARVLVAAVRGAGGPAGLGLALGVWLLYLLAPLTGAMLFGVRPVSATGLAVAVAVLAATALTAVAPVAWRVVSADPLEGLRRD